MSSFATWIPVTDGNFGRLFLYSPGSSNGRTAAFEAVNLGSNPSTGAIRLALLAHGRRPSRECESNVLSERYVEGLLYMKPLTFTVIAGRQHARRLGFRTLNFDISPGKPALPHGIYAGWVDINRTRYRAAKIGRASCRER